MGGDAGTTEKGPTTTVDPVDELWEMMDPIEPECPATDGSSGRHLQWSEAPPMCIDPARDYRATLHTDRGDIVIALDTETASIAVNNFVFLARWSYYDGVRFHRVVPQWVIQTGDPMGRPPGYGNPGYTIPDELPPDGSADPLYSVVMAGYANKPDSSGAQFSIVTGWESHHESRFTRFGRVIKGRGVVNAIDATGHRAAGIANSGHDGAPREPTTINTITITAEQAIPARRNPVRGGFYAQDRTRTQRLRPLWGEARGTVASRAGDRWDRGVPEQPPAPARWPAAGPHTGASGDRSRGSPPPASAPARDATRTAVPCPPRWPWGHILTPAGRPYGTVRELQLYSLK